MLVSGVGVTRRAEFGDGADNSAFRVSADSRLGRERNLEWLYGN
jgi:hypothetical protein